VKKQKKSGRIMHKEMLTDLTMFTTQFEPFNSVLSKSGLTLYAIICVSRKELQERFLQRLLEEGNA
jgi:hypothetical protein